MIVLALLAPLALASQASACTCAPESEAERFADSDGAVVVRLSEVIDSEPSSDGEKHTYRVLRVFKGPPSLERRESLTLVTSSQSSACGLGRGRASRGLYLYGRPGRWGSDRCSQTTPRAMRHAAARAGGDRRFGRPFCT